MGTREPGERILDQIYPAYADTGKVVQSLSFLLHLPGIKSLLGSSKECSRCGINHLELGIEDFLGRRRSPRCLKGRIIAKAVVKALEEGKTGFGVSEAQMRQALENPFTRRGLLAVIRGIATFGLTEPLTVAAPFLIVWNLTNACNLNCLHCYQAAGKPLPDELTTDEKISVIDELEQEGVVAIAFSGGEPLMARDFFAAAEHAAKRGMYVSVATNGTLITERMAHRLKECGVCYAEVSLDGASAEVHDAFRGIPGVFNMTLRGIKNLVSAGIDTCIATTAVSTNYGEIPKIVEIAKNLGVKRFMMFNFIPTGRGTEIVNRDLSPIQREDLLKYLYQVTTTTEVTALCTAPQFSRLSLQLSDESRNRMVSPTHFAAYPMPGETLRLASFIGGCGAGRMYCAIQPNGIVTPCVFIPSIKIGDLRRQSFREIWHSHGVLDNLRDRTRLKGVCGTCDYRNVCGGCRARALGYYGDILAPDPGCILTLHESDNPLVEAVYSTLK